MDFEEIKKTLREGKIVNVPKEDKRKKLAQELEYYNIPCSKESFDGEVIKLSGDEFYVFFQKYSVEPEYDFRERLHKMDDWLYDKPYNVQKRWLTYIPKWLKKDS